MFSKSNQKLLTCLLLQLHKYNNRGHCPDHQSRGEEKRTVKKVEILVVTKQIKRTSIMWHHKTFFYVMELLLK